MATTANLGMTVDQPYETPFYSSTPTDTTHVRTVDDNFRLIDTFAGTKGQAGGIAGLGADGKVPSSQLPEISAGVEIERLVTVYDIIVTAYNCTYTGDNTIAENGTATITFTAAGYELPDSVTVSGATSSWDSTTGVLSLSAPTGTVTVSVTADEEQPAYDPVFGNNSWADIRTAVRSGTVPNTWQVGDTKSVTLTNNEVMTVRITDTKADRYALSSGTGYAKMTFEFVEQFADTSYMNSTNTNAGGWANCYMRGTTMATCFALLPSDLQEAISEVAVLSGTGSGSTIGTSSSANKLFLPCEYEIFGTQTFSIGSSEAGSGGQFEYYITHNTAADRIKYSAGTAQVWWLRSPSSAVSGRFCSVGSTGNADTILASYQRGVAPCFAI